MASKYPRDRVGDVRATIFTLLKWLVFYPAVVLLILFALLVPLTVVVLQKVVASVVGALVSGVATFASLTMSLVILVAYGAWLILRADWIALAAMLPEVLDWLRGAGML